MRWIYLTGLLGALTFFGAVSGDHCCKSHPGVSTGGKVSKLVEQWKGVSTHLASLSPEERSHLAEKMKSATKACPLGSRMGETLSFTSRAFSTALQIDHKIQKACTAAKSDPSEQYEKVATLVKTRGELLRDLRRLAHGAAHATGALHGEPTGSGSYAALSSGSCGEKSAAASLSCGSEKAACGSEKAAAKGDSQKEGCCSSGATGGCCKTSEKAASSCSKTNSKLAACSSSCTSGKTAASLAAVQSFCPVAVSREATGLVASWRKGRAEYSKLSPEQKVRAHASVADLGKGTEVVRLVPETLKGLSEGLHAIAGLDESIHSVLAENAEWKGKISTETREAYEAQTKLLRETRAVLAEVLQTMAIAMESAPQGGNA